MSLPMDEKVRIAGQFMQHVMPDITEDLDHMFLGEVKAGGSTPESRERSYFTLRALDNVRAAISRYINRHPIPAPGRTEPI